MKALPFIILVAAALTSCGFRDPIDRIVKKESANPYFPSGLTAIIRLPATASVAEIASRALGQSGTNVIILETRQVRISHEDEDKSVPPELLSYTAVLVDTGPGQKVVLLQFIPSKRASANGWWSRVYDL